MSSKTVFLWVVLAVFAAISLYATLQVGYLGIWQSGIANWGAFQILADLVIACALICVWMVVDARQRGANAWPFVVLTVFSGSFGPLLYLLVRARRAGHVSVTAA